eukprot:NODE_1183_length_2573_cov_3.412919.p1 GENE.NODE_1183_length_2573_cov_3.412919~~NODE_1183_length_2573_cov_3.412919.p1  ORF type:complete len:671 (-),score=203.64 NODE_1183_length_2573_cov_3.412919:559-2460(-)
MLGTRRALAACMPHCRRCCSRAAVALSAPRVGSWAAGAGCEASRPSPWAATAMRAAAVAAVSAGTAALSLPSSPARCAPGQKFSVGNVKDYEEGAMREVSVGPEGNQVQVLVHRHGKEFFVTATTCAHMRAPLKKGVTSSGKTGGPPSVTCALHDATFDLKTGKVIRGPARDGIASYPVTIADGAVWTELPDELFASGGKHVNVPTTFAKRDLKDERVFALIGGGCASLAAAETLRQEGFGGRIVMITREAHLPYDRVVLSKGLDETAASLRLRSEEFFEEAGIEVMLETTVKRLDTRAQEITLLPAGAGKKDTKTLKYDRVLVAAGGTPRKLFCPGSKMKNIFTLRTPEDAAEINKVAQKGKKIVVVGGSFIGMEIATSLKARGCEVTVVALESVPFERVLGKKVGASFARVLQKEGVQWTGSSQVRQFRGNTAVNGVELEDGEVLPADGVVIGAGVLPNTRFVEGVSLDKNGALIVGKTLASEAVPTLFAAGDVCSFPSTATGEQVRIEHWDVATQQGRVAARSMLGQKAPFDTVPFFWSHILGQQLRFVGYAPAMLERVIVEGDTANMKFVTYYTENDEVRAVATVNRDPVAVACAELMRRGKMPKVSEFVVGSVNGDVLLQRLKDLGKK